MSHMHERNIGTIVVSSISLVVIRTVDGAEFLESDVVGRVGNEPGVARSGLNPSGVTLAGYTADSATVAGFRRALWIRPSTGIIDAPQIVTTVVRSTEGGHQPCITILGSP